MRTMFATIALLTSTMLIACSGTIPASPSIDGMRSITPQTSGVIVTQADRRLPEVIVVPGIDCPSAAPKILVSATNVTESTGYISLEWAINPLSDQVRITVLKDENNIDTLFRVIREEMSKGSAGISIRKADGSLLDAGIYTVQVAYEYNLKCGGNLSNVSEEVVGIATPVPVAKCKPRGYHNSSYDRSCKPRRHYED